MEKRKLDFCPYEIDPATGEFKKIDLSNLAYELIFLKGHGIGELEDALGDLTDIVQKTEDKIRKENYRDSAVHYYLKPAIGPRLSGIESLTRRVEREAERFAKSDKSSDVVSDVIADGWETEIKKDSSNLTMEWKKTDQGGYVFSYALVADMIGTVMKAVPCCPECHARLPIDWLDADDFCGIDFMADTGVGKTTYLLSLMANNWDALNWIDGWEVLPAHELGEQDYLYEELKKASDCMTSKTSQRKVCYCPGNTVTDGWIQPIFLRVIYKGRKIIVGLYDNSGENIEQMDPNDERLQLLSNMSGHIYFIEPKQMRISLPTREKEKTTDTQEVLELLSIEAQGKFQEQNQGKSCIARELIQEVKPAVTVNHTTGAFNILRKYQTLLANIRRRDVMKNQHVCATIIKCDLLEEVPEILEKPNHQFLFQRGNVDDIFRNQGSRERIVKDLFQDFIFDGQRESVLFRAFDNNVSYHCVSAIGCDTEEQDVNIGDDMHPIKARRFVLKDDYAPIRVAEPLMTCLQKRVEYLGW